ncbi:hypothetical protein SKAU_G00342980 [Synaphobranchus kaupii]|uniref:Ig-like domain-containing protein n=1 Tax=Synaphobranchus kaupii TaxID=118154 RepID=A0A9Q1EJ04_SYNKA|nr:hypothetical protein SKAU_G00342980 [Synaphobranchus kaupii]
MKKLKTEDSGYYWCAVEIGSILALDESSYLYLSVTADTPGLWVDQQEVTGVEGGHVSVQCHYNELYDSKTWCRAGGSCVEASSGKSGITEIRDVSSIKLFMVTVRELNREDAGWYWCAAGELQIPVHITVTQKTTTTTVTTLRADSPKVEGETLITDDPTHHVFTVTMTNLKTGDSGYYWCAVEIKDAVDEGSYLYLSVTDGTPGLWVDQQEVTVVEGGHVSVQCHYNEPNGRKSWCRAGKSGTSEIKDVSSKKVFIVTVRELNREDTGCPSDIKIVLMALGILLLAVAVAMVTRRLWKRHGQEVFEQQRATTESEVLKAEISSCS